MSFRDGLNRLMNKYRFGTLIVAHTPKTNSNPTADYDPSDWQYRIAGSAILTNWARAMIVIDPATGVKGTFRFIAAKRGGRIGWSGWERWFKHSEIPGMLRWEPTAAIKPAEKAKTKPLNLEKAFSIVPPIEPISKSVFAAKLRDNGFTEKDAKDATVLLHDDGRIYEWRVKRPKGQPGGKLQYWSRHPQPADTTPPDGAETSDAVESLEAGQPDAETIAEN